MPHLYHYAARFDYWDADENFREGRSDGATLIAHRVETPADYREWRGELQRSLGVDIGKAIIALRIDSFSYLGETEEGGGNHD